MILTKQFLNEKVKTRILDENLKFQKRQELDTYDVFISYSWNDRSFAYKVVELLENCGYTVYVDYNDLKLENIPGVELAWFNINGIPKVITGVVKKSTKFVIIPIIRT